MRHDCRLPKTKWNVSQPEDPEARENALDNGFGLDLMVVPGVAFTVGGDRLGRGKGYYDTYLQRLAANAGRLPVTVGVGFGMHSQAQPAEVPA